MTDLQPTPEAKMIYLIRRRSDVSREELLVHWFGNHMSAVIEGQHARAAQGKWHANRYIVTLFDANAEGEHPWDGMAQLWFGKPLPKPETPQGTVPGDTFQEKAEPYVPWATREYVVMDGALPVEPNTLDAPFPCTRSGFFKVTFLVKAGADTDFDAFFAHWLDVHVPNVRSTMEQVGGFRYVVSHSLDPNAEPCAGMAELYFPSADGWRGYREHIRPDGMERWVEDATVLRAGTQMIGIP